MMNQKDVAGNNRDIIIWTERKLHGKISKKEKGKLRDKKRREIKILKH